jgi:hypothetical protein
MSYVDTFPPSRPQRDKRTQGATRVSPASSPSRPRPSDGLAATLAGVGDPPLFLESVPRVGVLSIIPPSNMGALVSDLEKQAEKDVEQDPQLKQDAEKEAEKEGQDIEQDLKKDL